MKTLRALKCFATLKVAPAEGQEFSCPDDEAEDLIRAGYAEEVKTETAKEPEPEESKIEEPEPEESKKEEPEDEGEQADDAADSAAPKRGRRKPAGK